MRKITGVGIHFGAHPPASSTLDVLTEREGGGVDVRRYSLVDLDAVTAAFGDAVVSGSAIVDAIEQMVAKLPPHDAAPPTFKRG